MATSRGYYEILNLSNSANADEIKRAYRKLALEYHPDRNKTREAEEKFKEINQAYEVLSDPQKRQLYDQVGHAAFEQGAGQGPFGDQGPFGGFGQGRRAGPFNYTYYSNKNGESPFEFDFGGFSDPFEIFEQFFGGGTTFGKRKPTYSLSIDFMDAVYGVTKKVTVNGKAQDIKIPKGVRDGSRIRFDDFDVLVSVRKHPRFQREGYDIITEQEITMVQAALGDIIDVETVDGVVKVKIPEGTQPNSLIRVRGKGIPHLQGNVRGDHYIRMLVKVPTKLSSHQKDLLREFESSKKSKWF